MTGITERRSQLPLMERRPVWLPSVVVAAMAVIAVLPIGSAYFVTLRIAIVTWAVLTVVHTFRSARRDDGLLSVRVWPFLLAGVVAGVLWWPYSFTFHKSVWVVLDLMFAAVALTLGWRLERTHETDGPRWPALGVTVLLVAIIVPGMLWLMSERAAADTDREWCRQQDTETQAFHPRCGGGDPDSDGGAPGSDHYPG